MSERTPTVATSVEQHVATGVHALRMLHALGDTKEQVANALTAAGFRGCTPSTSNCIIANYLMRSGLQVACVNVLGEFIVLGFDEENPDDAEVLTTPWPVEQFIDAFDKGAYPWLVEQPRVFEPQPPARDFDLMFGDLP